VNELCPRKDTSFSRLRKWYDGYLLNGAHIYNKSVVDAITRNKIKSYWTGTETYEALKVYIDILTLLIHLGYLAFDEATEEAFTPNQEIMQKFIRSVKTRGWDGLIRARERSEGLL